MDARERANKKWQLKFKKRLETDPEFKKQYQLKKAKWDARRKAKNPEEYRKKNALARKEYVKKNKERLLVKMREYRERNRDKIREHARLQRLKKQNATISIPVKLEKWYKNYCGVKGQNMNLVFINGLRVLGKKPTKKIKLNRIFLSDYELSKFTFELPKPVYSFLSKYSKYHKRTLSDILRHIILSEYKRAKKEAKAQKEKI